MPSDVPSTPPQLPPIKCLASLSNWRWGRHSPDFTSTASSSSRLHPRRSDSVSPPPRPLPYPPELVPSDSKTRSRVERVAPSYSPPPSSCSSLSSKSHKHSQSYSRGIRPPLPTLPSASSPGSIVIITPPRTHSRSASAGLLKISTSRPSSADRDNMSRPLPKVPKQITAPPSLTGPGKEATATLALPLPPRRAVTPSPESPAVPTTVLTPPPRPKATQDRSQVLYVAAETPRVANSTSPRLPHSAPVGKGEKEKAQRKIQKKGMDHRPVLIVFNPDQPFLNMHEPTSEPSAPESYENEAAPNAESSENKGVAPPIPPKPRVAPSSVLARTQTQSQAQPRLTSRTNQLTIDTNASAKRHELPSPRVPAPPPSSARKRVAKLSIAMRTSVGAAAAPLSPKRPANINGLACKWVVERRGKRVTVKPQDAMVVAERLRMLR